MKLTKLTLLLFVAGTTLSMTAQARSSEQGAEPSELTHKKHHRPHHAKRAKRMMKRIDVNEDGQIDLNEYLMNAEQRFQAMDLDSNGLVTKEEMRAFGKEVRKKHREAMKAARKDSRDTELSGSD